MRAGVALALLLIPAEVVAAGWQIDRKVDAMSDRQITAAVVQGELGGELRIERDHEGDIVGAYRIGRERKMDTVAAGLRVDDGTPVAVIAHVRKPQRIEVSFEDPGAPIFEGIIREMMEGRSLAVRVVLEDGSHHDERFSLSGSAPALAAALGIPEKLTQQQKLDYLVSKYVPKETTIEEKAEQEARRHCQRKLTDPVVPRCYQAIEACKDKYDGQGEDLVACFAAIRPEDYFLDAGRR